MVFEVATADAAVDGDVEDPVVGETGAAVLPTAPDRLLDGPCLEVCCLRS